MKSPSDRRTLVVTLLSLFLILGCEVTEPSIAEAGPPPSPGAAPEVADTPMSFDECLRLANVVPEVVAFAFQDQGETLLVQIGTGALQRWSLTTGEMMDEQQLWSGERLYNAAFTLDGSQLAVGKMDNSILVWDVVNGICSDTLFGHSSFVVWVTFSGDGSRLASADVSGNIYLWDLQTGEEAAHWNAHDHTIGSLKFNRDATLLASGGAEGSYDIKLWSLPGGDAVSTLSGHTGNVYNIAFVDQETGLISVSGDGTMRIWDLDAGLVVASIDVSAGRVYGLGLTADEQIMVTSDNRGEVKVWSRDTRDSFATLIPPDPYAFESEFSVDGQLLAVRARSSDGQHGSMIVWRYGFVSSVPER